MMPFGIEVGLMKTLHFLNRSSTKKSRIPDQRWKLSGCNFPGVLSGGYFTAGKLPRRYCPDTLFIPVYSFEIVLSSNSGMNFCIGIIDLV